MSNEGFKLQASVKDTDGDMVNVRADSLEEFEANLLAFPGAAYAQFKANVRGGSSLGAVVQAAPQQQAAPFQSPEPAPTWATGAPQQAAPPQQQGGFRPRGQVHPEGRTCEACPNPLELKKTTTGKSKWQCDAWRWNNGNPNGHTSEFIN